ncbi:RNA recognition motif domain [Dillenia turbinata]|uniref:RNA recognition motif domain n=1 Tax=Dillenia turbinata TaxID=194707 RepID=A0AAN8VVY9_9MAGN
MQQHHQQQRLKQQQAMMLQQQSLYHHPALLAPPQIEPILSGNLPPGFDSSTCRSVCGKHSPSSYRTTSTGGFLKYRPAGRVQAHSQREDYFDRRSASLAIVTLNGRQLLGQPIKDAQSAISDLNVMETIVSFSKSWLISGKRLGSRPIRCNWAAKGAVGSEDKPTSDTKSVVELTNGSLEDGQERTNDDAPENNPQYTTVTSVDLHRHFHALGAGAIEDVRVQREKGFGFVRYSTHAEAALAIQVANARLLFGKPIKCSWGSKPTPPGAISAPLPPPTAAQVPAGLSATDLATYDRQLALSKMGGAQALMHPQSQHALKAMGIGIGAAGGSQAIYDGGYQNPATSQHLMYY